MRPSLFLLLLVGLLTPSALADDWSAAALGANGTMYRLHSGASGDLFPAAGETSRAPVLALDVHRADGERSRHIVPGTEGDDIESSLSLVVDDGSGSVYVLWESWYGIAQSRLQLIGLSGDGWTEPIEISASPYVRKNSPKLALTRDAIHVEAEGATIVRQRTILHVAWVEEGDHGGRRPLYVPLLLVDGEYLGAGARVALDSLLASDEPLAPVPSGTPLVPSDTLLDALTIRPGTGGGSVIVAFADEESRSVATVEIQVVPGELSALADELERFVLESGENPQENPDAVRRIADGARPHLIDFGYRIQPALLPHLATEAATFLAAQDASVSLDGLAAASREHLIDYGTQLDRSGVRRIASGARPHLIDFGVSGTIDERHARFARRHDVRLIVSSLRPAPQTPERPIRLLVSPIGKDVLISWQDAEAGELLYLDSEPSGWSAVNVLEVGETLPLANAEQLLNERIESR